MNFLTSDRFQLRYLEAADATSDYINWLNSEVSQYILNKPKSINSLEKYIEEQHSDSNVYFYGIFTLDNDKHIGNIKFIIKGENRDCVEMGILIGEKSWHGKGVAKEVIECFASHAKQQLGISKMQLGVDSANTAAVSAYYKIGFKVVNDGRDDGGLTMLWEF
ncbi:GNAT family N-acetyltransferase [Pseudoalteromonas sp. ASV78]|uniref:GNAT family N-acetyltransferase n=1 Tax=Pseudoalteromonas sp. ASV78 TaxID=3397851 RepID=UPI0039FD5117